ncbi:MAG: hypothetical protein Q7J21_04350, partial [Rugosibacter sp.]|nr:hypothetical protein [Rugosibacter sp.]
PKQLPTDEFVLRFTFPSQFTFKPSLREGLFGISLVGTGVRSKALNLSMWRPELLPQATIFSASASKVEPLKYLMPPLTHFGYSKSECQWPDGGDDKLAESMFASRNGQKMPCYLRIS